MSIVPLTEQEIAEDYVILNLHNIAFSDDDFIELCADNRELLLELTAQKELIVIKICHNSGSIALL